MVTVNTPCDLRLKLSPTQYRFVNAEARYPWLIGPEGEGKTFAAIASYFAHYERVKATLPVNPLTGVAYPMLGALVRDTHANLKRITVRSIERGFPGVFEFYDDCHRMKTDGLEIDLLGMDAEDALGRIQGGEYDIIHVEEPAPIVHTGNQGMREEVYEVCMRRIRGGLNRPKRLGVSMNPGPKLHWTYKWAISNPVPDTVVFRIKKGENPYVSEEDRVARAQAFRFRPDLAKRYDEGEFADTYPGVAITPEYKPDQHLAKEWLLPIPGLECIRLYDGGLNPTCVILQFTPSGRLHFLDAVQLKGGGMQQLIQSRLKIVLARPRYKSITKWRDLGDEALKSREQSNSEHSAAKIIEDLLKTTYEGGIQDWETRKNALKFIFTQSPDGLPMVQINPRPTEGEEVNLIECAFSGGYSYPVNAMGVVSREGPDKASRFCVDLATEMLTTSGWKAYHELAINDCVFAYSHDSLGRGRLALSRITALHHYSEPSQVLMFNGQNLDMCVTLNHRCVVGHRWQKGIRLEEASALNASDYILRASPYRNQWNRWYSDDFVRLCAWIMAEGTYAKDGGVLLTQSIDSNGPYCDELNRLVSQHGRHTSWKSRSGGGSLMWVWRFTGEHAASIRAVMPEKIISGEFLIRLTQRQRRLFLYEMIRGDGTWESGECLPAPPDGGFPTNRTFFVRPMVPRIFQVNRHAIDMLQMLCVLLGLRASIRQKRFRNEWEGWTLSVTREGAWTSVNKLERRISEAQEVWCPQTEHGTWVARRNGLVFITGNSHVGDAIGHGLAKLFFRPQESVSRRDQKKAQQRSRSYAVSAA